MSTNASIRVQPGAANYFSLAGVLDQIERFPPASALNCVLWISGKRAQAAAAPFLPPFHADPKSIRLDFSGHCSERRVQNFARQGTNADLVIGLGGGSALDTAKAVAHRLRRPFIAIPTIAATCAAWTLLSVWYDDDGNALEFEIFPLASHLVLVEPRIDGILAGGGLIGGLGERYTRLAAAHSIHNGLTALPETEEFLHGAKVAYGILVQLALEEKLDELRQLAATLRPIGMPTSLAERNVGIEQHEKIEVLIARSLRSGESIPFLNGGVDAFRLRHALATVETA